MSEPRFSDFFKAENKENTSECIFCGFVVDRSRHSQMVYEDEVLLAILEDFPMSRGHTLVILKEHHPDLTTVSPADAGAMGSSVARIAAAIKNALGAAKMIYVASIGEQVQHVHYHLIPRYEEDTKGYCFFMSSRGCLTDPEPIVARIREELMRQ